MLRICTSNRGKAEEISRILGVAGEPVKIDLTEIQAIDPAVVSGAKAAEAFALLGEPVLVDDTSLSIDALGGFPGALVAWALKGGGVELLGRMLPAGAAPHAVATTAIGYADARGVRVFVGAARGTLLSAPRGTGGFGFDPVFIPDGADLTFAEMTPAQKDAFSPRRLALEQLARFLTD